MSSKQINLNTQTRPQALRNILKAMFAPRIAFLTAHAQQLAQSIQTRSEPAFTAYYADKALRPFLQYSNGHKFLFATFAKDEGGVERKSNHYLAVPKLILGTPVELRIRPIDSYYGEAGTLICVLAHDTGTIPTADELVQLEAIVAANQAMLAEFEAAHDIVNTALHSFKTVKAFHEHYPEFKAISGLAETVEQPGKVPAPTHDNIIGKLASMGLLAAEAT